MEIEHKYLVSDSTYKDLSTGSEEIIQGYLSKDPQRTVRIRRRGNRCFITVKGKNNGDTRQEFEYEIPQADFEAMLHLCLPGVITKRRWIVPFGGYIWEVDEFSGNLQGLVLAEIELESSHRRYPLPPFVGQDVTGNPAYYNSNLSLDLQ